MRPRKPPDRTSAIAARVPRMVASVADRTADAERDPGASSTKASSWSSGGVPARRPAAPHRDGGGVSLKE